MIKHSKHKLAAAAVAVLAIIGAALVATVATAQPASDAAAPPLPEQAQEQPPGVPPPPRGLRDKVQPELREAVERGDDTRAIVTYGDPDDPAAEVRAKAAALQLPDAQHITREVVLVRHLNRGLLTALEANPNVKRIEIDQVYQPAIAAENAITGFSTASTGMWAQGYTGAGMMVGIMDTGFDTSHTWLSGKITNEWCHSGGTSGCPGGVDNVSGTGKAAPCAATTACGHGTGTASVILSQDATEKGAAYGADGIGMRVTDSTGSGYTTAFIAGLDYILANTNSSGVWTANSKPLAAINLSFAAFDGTCTVDSTFFDRIDSVKARGISFVVAAGNNSHTGAMSNPACYSNVMSVANYSSSTGTFYTNSDVSLLTDVAAPAVSMTIAKYPGGGSTTGTGTSFAAPQVVAALTEMRQAQSTSTLAQREQTLSTIGTVINDTRSGQIGVQVRLLNALGAVSALTNSYMPTASSKFVSNPPAYRVMWTGSTGYGGTICAGCIRGLDLSHTAGWGSLRVKAAWVTVTTLNATSNGYVTTWAYPGAQPTAVTAGVRSGKTTTNSALIGVNSDGVAWVYSSVATDVIIEVTGFMGANASDFTSIYGARAVSNGSVAAFTEYASAVIPGGLFAGVSIPSGVTAIVANVNVGATAGAISNFVTYSASGTAPTVSTVAVPYGEPAYKLAVIKLDAAGKFYYRSSTATSVSIDIVGYVTGSSSMVAMTPVRLANSVTHTGPCYNTSGSAISCTSLGASGQVDIAYGGSSGIPSSALGVFGNFVGAVGTANGTSQWKTWQQGVTNTGFYSLFFNTPPSGSYENANEPIAVGLNTANGRVSLQNYNSTWDFYAEAQAYFPA